MFRRFKPRFAVPFLILCGTTAVSLPSEAVPVESVSAASEVVATWRGGSLSREEYDDWRSIRGAGDDPEVIRELAYVRSMAAATESRGARDELWTRIQLEAVRQSLLLPPLREHVEASVTVGDHELEATLHEHPDAFHQPLRIKLLNLYKSLGEGEQAVATRVRMEEIRGQLIAGADFEKLARAESESQTRYRGGNLGFVSMNDLPPPIAAAVRDLEPGEVSDVVEHAGGLTLLRCEEVREARVPPAAEQRAKVRASLLRHHRKKAWPDFQRALWEAAEPKLHPQSKETVLEMKGYRLTRAGLRVVLDLSKQETDISDLGDEAVEALLTRWGSGVLAVRRAFELGLDRDPAVASALRWKPIEALAQRELVHRVDERLDAPDEKELRRAFVADPRRYRQPAGYELAAIHFRLAEGAVGEEQAAAAVEVERQLADGELTFAEAARRHSDLPTAERGGYLGWLPRRQAVNWGPVVSDALKQMQPGERSGLLRNEAGLWIFELRGERPARAMSFEEARPQVIEELSRQRIEGLERQIRDEQLALIEVVLVGEAAAGERL